jgi:hypothetical protein
VVEAIDYAATQFPFPIKGIDSDNGAEFINAHLFDCCSDRKITFTRSRAGNKNDGAHVEQKNWTHVRQLVGYLRFDSPEELSVLNELWSLDGLFTNYLLAQQKLIEKHRHGAKVTKRHDRAQTPYQRATDHERVSELTKAAMKTTLNSIRFCELSDQIETLTTRLEHLALTKTTAPTRRVNKPFNRPLHPEVFSEATN